MLDPNYNLTVLESMLRERQHQLQKEMETGWRLRPFLAERLGAIERLRLHIGNALISFGMKLKGQLSDAGQPGWANNLR